MIPGLNTVVFAMFVGHHNTICIGLRIDSTLKFLSNGASVFGSTWASVFGSAWHHACRLMTAIHNAQLQPAICHDDICHDVLLIWLQHQHIRLLTHSNGPRTVFLYSAKCVIAMCIGLPFDLSICIQIKLCIGLRIGMRS